MEPIEKLIIKFTELSTKGMSYIEPGAKRFYNIAIVLMKISLAIIFCCNINKNNCSWLYSSLDQLENLMHTSISLLSSREERSPTHKEAYTALW